MSDLKPPSHTNPGSSPEIARTATARASESVPNWRYFRQESPICTPRRPGKSGGARAYEKRCLPSRPEGIVIAGLGIARVRAGRHLRAAILTQKRTAFVLGAIGSLP